MIGRLTRVHVQGYRRLADVVLEPGPGVTVVIGENASGKSTLLDACQVVADLALGSVDPFGGEARGSLDARSCLDEMILVGRRPRRMSIDLDFECSGRSLKYEVTIDSVRNNFSVVSEHLAELGDDGPRVLLERDASGGRLLHGAGDSAQLAPRGVGTAQAMLAQGGDRVACPEVYSAWRFLAGMCILRLTPALMRRARQPDVELVRPDRYGRDLSARLHALQTSAPTAVPTWLSHMGEFVGWTEIRTPVRSGVVEASFLQEGSSHPVHLVQASDGSVVHAYLSCLAVDPPAEVSVYLVDEPGTPYFASDVSRLGALIGALGSGRRQVLAATHSPAVAEELGSLDNVWILRRGAEGSSTIRRVPADDPLFAKDTALRGIGPASFDEAASGREA